MKSPSMGIACVLLVLPTAVFAADPIQHVERPDGIPSFLGYAPDACIVVMKEDVGKLRAEYSAGAIAHVGDAALDALADRFRVSLFQQQFPGSEPGSRSRTADLARYYKIRFEAGSLEEVMAAYERHPSVAKVEPIGIHALYATPNDTYYSPYQTYHNQANDHDIDSPEAWDIQTGSTAVTIALLDSGTRYYHPDLGGVNATVSNPGAARGNMWINWAEKNGTPGVDDDSNGYTDDWIGYDFIDGVSNCWTGEDCNTKDNDPRDFNGHGTHTAGIMGMLTNDGYGMAGVAGGWGNGSQAETGNGVKIMPLRMGYSYNYLGQEYGVVMMDAAAEAFYYAANNGAVIASCSWGSSNSGGLGAAVDYFLNSGGLIFVAAGNSGNQTADYLNGRGDCISVSAVDANDAAASFTSYGTWVDICAPGVSIYSTYHDHTDPNTTYWASMSGTSMATPMTAAVGALIWSQNPGWTAAQVESQLYASAENIDAYLSSTYIGKMGAGRINSYNAVNTGPPPPPVAAFTGSPTSGTAPLTVNFTDQSTGSITSWSWTFGDGGTSPAQNPSHQYTNAGTYTVTLTVTGPGGSDDEIKTGYITVSPCVAPVAAFVGSPTSGDAPLTVNFTDQSTNSPASWSWTFGDGGTSYEQNPSHVYTGAGTYTVTLVAANSCGSDDFTRTDYINVTEASGVWVTITYDDFEGGFGNYTDGGTDCLLYTGGTYAHQGSNAADIQDNSGTASSFYHTGDYNVSIYDNLEVEFWFRAVSMDNSSEDFWVQYYDGSTWRTVATYARSIDFDNNVFYNKVVAIPKGTYSYPTNAKLRFMCDASGNADDAYIDEITFRGFSSGGGPTPPAAPSDLDAVAASSSQIDLTWTDNSEDEDGFRIERSLDGSSFGEIETVDANVTSFSDTDLAASTTYWYRVRAYNVAGNSDYSNTASATTQASGGGWVTITYDDFEGGFGNYTDGGGDCALYTGGTYAHQGSNAADIQDNSGTASSFYHTAGYDVSGYAELEVEFWFYAVSMDNTREDFWVQYYDGSAWRTVATYARTTDFDNNVFYNKIVTIPKGTYNYPANAKLRFLCDASGNTDDVYIDEIEFRGFSSGSSQGEASLLTARPALIPTEFSVTSFPNPFRSATTVQFGLPAEAHVEIAVYNVAGRKVATVADAHYPAGMHSVRWEARTVASGLYFYQIRAGSHLETKRMMLLR
jgi:PKD repeat protein